MSPNSVIVYMVPFLKDLDLELTEPDNGIIMD